MKKNALRFLVHCEARNRPNPCVERNYRDGLVARRVTGPEDATMRFVPLLDSLPFKTPLRISSHGFSKIWRNFSQTYLKYCDASAAF